MRNTSSTSAVRLSRSPQFEHVTHRVYRASDVFPCFRPSGRFSVKEACWLPMALLLPQILADRIPGHIMKFRAYLSRITSDLFDDLIDLHKGDYIRYYTWGNGVASRSALLIAEFMTFTILAVWRGDDPSAAYVSAQCSSSPLLSISRLRDRRSCRCDFPAQPSRASRAGREDGNQCRDYRRSTLSSRWRFLRLIVPIEVAPTFLRWPPHADPRQLLHAARLRDVLVGGLPVPSAQDAR